MRVCVAAIVILANILSPAGSLADEVGLPAYDFETACANYAASPSVAIIAQSKGIQVSPQKNDQNSLQEKFKTDCADRNRETRLSLVLMIDRIDGNMMMKCDSIAKFHLPYYYVSFFDCVHHALKVLDKSKRRRS